MANLGAVPGIPAERVETLASTLPSGGAKNVNLSNVATGAENIPVTHGEAANVEGAASVFNHPSTNRPTASLHQQRLSSDQAKANAAFSSGNQKAYRAARQQAASEGVNLASYSTRAQAANNKAKPKPQAT